MAVTSDNRSSSYGLPNTVQWGVITRGIRAFVARDWQAVRDAKDDYWRDRIARLGPLEGLRVSEQLRRQMLARDPAWPRPSDRREDLLAHVRLAKLLRRASPTRHG